MSELTQNTSGDGGGEAVRLVDCPVGLFVNRYGGLCLKTEYGNNEGRIDAYIVESGEFFWGDPPQTITSQRAEPVRPIDLDRVSAALAAPAAKSGAEDWRDDPSADERWNAGLDYGMEQLCVKLGVDTQEVCWDAATETLDGDVRSVIGNILTQWAGDDWQDAPARLAASPPPPAGSAGGDVDAALQKSIADYPVITETLRQSECTGAAGGGSGDLGEKIRDWAADVCEGVAVSNLGKTSPIAAAAARFCAQNIRTLPIPDTAPTPDLGAQGEPVAWKVAQIIAHNLCGYVDEVDAENFLNGASKTAQEILTLVSSASQTARPAWVKAYEAECQRDGADFDAEACIAENFPQIVAEQQPAAQSKAVARDAVLAVVRAAWALVDNTGVHDLLPLAVNRDDWNDLAARFAALKSLLPADELPADPPHAVAYFWPTNAALSEAPAAPRSSSGVTVEEAQAAFFYFLCRKYVQRSDARQNSMGLQYTEAETHDLAKEVARFALALLQAPRPGETGDGCSKQGALR